MDQATDLNASSPRLIMVTGGQRSGKSLFAESLALSLSERPAYLATARVYDDEMRRRVELHQARRAAGWRNLEAPLSLYGLTFTAGETVLVDCLTLWATNWLFELGEDADKALSALKAEIDTLRSKGLNIIIVTNEIGLGGVSDNALQRKFADLQGLINQYVASLADEVYMVVAGIPVKIKPQQ